jgi:hypothetical protein
MDGKSADLGLAGKGVVDERRESIEPNKLKAMGWKWLRQAEAALKTVVDCKLYLVWDLLTTVIKYK